jgi:hypothetical protein
MIQPLRRVHRRVFVVLAIALPVILFIGLRWRHPRVETVPVPMPPSAHLEKLP